MPALTPTQTRSILTSLGIRPRKKLGQNFLIDGNIVAKSLDLAEVCAGDTIVEVGPGLGTLTAGLLERGATVNGIEIDPRLVGFLRSTYAAEYADRFSLHQGDAVDQPLAGLRGAANGSFKVVANLPYAISTPWMDGIIEGPLPSRMVLMLQREAAGRFRALPGTRSFGAITVFLQSAFEIDRGHPVGRSSFYPPPEVDSVLLNLKLRRKPFRFSPQIKIVIRNIFTQRRKQIGTLLRVFAAEFDAGSWLEKLEAEGYSSRSRPEEIPPELWQLFEA